MISVNFLTTYDDNRKISKSYTIDRNNVACDIFESCDLYNPVLIVKTSNSINSNYLYIPAFSRYYFIVNKNLDKAGLTIINCECDVLMSFKDRILRSKQLIIRSEEKENIHVKNSLIVDNNLPLKQLTLSDTIQVTGAELQHADYYILTTLAGNNGKFASPIERNVTNGN